MRGRASFPCCAQRRSLTVFVQATCRRPSARLRDRPCAIRRNVMAKFTIQPHGRLQEWIAHEKGYFRDAGLDYEFRGGLSAERKKEVDASGKIVDVFSGAFESYEQGKGNRVSNRTFPARATGRSI